MGSVEVLFSPAVPKDMERLPKNDSAPRERVSGTKIKGCEGRGKGGGGMVGSKFQNAVEPNEGSD